MEGVTLEEFDRVTLENYTANHRGPMPAYRVYRVVSGNEQRFMRCKEEVLEAINACMASGRPVKVDAGYIQAWEPLVDLAGR